ncbi:hypothetical protein FRUB_04447 [Fimbriiglobus ruber]|uniref:Uncharacterized protein n=1 Tax=Fimbriiglobus ruber TaxID=1908690 RepID=A0A225DYQ2_9BACT|nr:hypothetical protein FRUB_04447 [Fimbriiglobus ruber]
MRLEFEMADAGLICKRVEIESRLNPLSPRKCPFPRLAVKQVRKFEP